MQENLNIEVFTNLFYVISIVFLIYVFKTVIIKKKQNGKNNKESLPNTTEVKENFAGENDDLEQTIYLGRICQDLGLTVKDLMNLTKEEEQEQKK